MSKTNDFIEAYHRFRDMVDISENGVLPELEKLVYSLLVGVPDVPADYEKSEYAILEAIDQRVAILKAVFVESNKTRPDDFLDKGLMIYDKAANAAKELVLESGATDIPLSIKGAKIKGY